MNEQNQKVKLLTPMKEYRDYKEFCDKNKVEPVPGEEFYMGAYLLSLKALISGFGDNELTSYDLGDTVIILHDTGQGIILSLFMKDEINKLQVEVDKDIDGPTDHLG